MAQVIVCQNCKSEVEGVEQIVRCPSCHAIFEDPSRAKPVTKEKLEIPTELIHWDNRFLVGNKIIDEQHEQLCYLINDLHRAVQSRTYRANFILDTVKALLDYVSNHFRTEEALFVGTSYPDTELHLKEHHFFEEKARAIRKDYTEAQIDLKPVLRFLVEWFVRHVQQVDRGYKNHIGK